MIVLLNDTLSYYNRMLEELQITGLNRMDDTGQPRF